MQVILLNNRHRIFIYFFKDKVVEKEEEKEELEDIKKSIDEIEEKLRKIERKFIDSSHIVDDDECKEVLDKRKFILNLSCDSDQLC